VVHPYFGSWVLDLQPTTHTHGITPSPSSRSFVVPPDTGDAEAPWTLAVGGLDACGYTVTLWGYEAGGGDVAGPGIDGMSTPVERCAGASL
jgi:hypothetical protein